MIYLIFSLFLQLALVAQIGVFETEEIEYAVQSDGVDRLLGVGYHTGLGVEGNAEACLADHRQVVGAVAYGDGLCQIHLLHLGYQP